MIKRVVRQNLGQTLADLRDQTSLEAGGPTNRCHGVVLGGLSGARLDFAAYPDLTDAEKVALEQSNGLTRSMVVVLDRIASPMTTRGLLEILCLSKEPSFEAILVHGTAVQGD